MKTLYFGGAILSMEEQKPVESLLVEEGRILALGNLDEVVPLAQGATRVNLEGRALLPAFVDGHSHITALAQTLGLCQLDGCNSLQEVGQRLKAFRERWQIPTGEWVIGFGYDQNQLQEGCHPTAAVLDAFLPDCPAMVTHASGHMGAVNSLGMQKLGITANTPDPEGGKIGRLPDGSPQRLLGRGCLHQHGLPHPPGPVGGAEKLAAGPGGVLLPGDHHHPRGPDPTAGMGPVASSCFPRAAAGGRGGLHRHQGQRRPFGGTPGLLGALSQPAENCGYKLFLDGSPQGRTAWMTQPYLEGEPDYRGYPVYQDQEVLGFLEKSQREQVQIVTHCNGGRSSGTASPLL